MAGKIINSADREKLLITLLAIVEDGTTRRVLINAWRVGKLCFSGDDRRLEVLTNACAYRNSELGFTPSLKSVKGGKQDA